MHVSSVYTSYNNMQCNIRNGEYLYVCTCLSSYRLGVQSSPVCLEDVNGGQRLKSSHQGYSKSIDVH